MATPEEIAEQASAVMQPYLAAQDKNTKRLKESEPQQARLMHYASTVVAVAYAGFIVSRITSGKNLDALAIIVFTIMITSVVSTRCRYGKAKASLAAP